MTPSTGARRIVVGIDGSEHSRRALEWAVREAGHDGSEIDAVLAYDSGLAWIDVGSDAEALILAHSAEGAKRTLHDALASVDLEPDARMRVHPVTIAGEPSAMLVEQSRNADLLVVGTRGRGGFAGLLLGSVSQRCAERSACPVVVVPSPSRED